MPPGCSSVLQALGLQRSWLSSSLEPVCRNQHALGLGRSASRNRVVWGCFFEKPWEGLCSDDMSRDSDGVRLGEILSVLVAQSCLTLCDPMNYSLARPLLPGMDSPGKNSRVGSQSLLQGIFQGSNPDLLHHRQILYHLSHRGSPIDETVKINTSI